MREHKPLQLGLLDLLPKQVVLHLFHLAALGADLVMVRMAAVATLILRAVSKLMLHHQMGIEQQQNGVVERCTTHAEFLLLGHACVERLHVEMGVNGVNGIEYGKPLRRLAMPVQIQIFSKYLPYTNSLQYTLRIKLYKVQLLLLGNLCANRKELQSTII